jgi:hypothetical protein
MCALRYLPFDSTAGDRSITSADFAQLFETLADDGYVANEGTQLAVTEAVPPAMTVVVGTGAAWVQGRFLQIYNTSETLTIGAADPTNPRIDRIVIRRDLADRRMELAVKPGIPSPATNVEPPALQRDDTIWEISLAQVRVDPGAVAIYTANITDERNNDAVCGTSFHPSLGGANFIPDEPDSVGEGHINWGLGTDQISAVDIPIADGGLNYTAGNVEDALAEEADARQAHEARRDNPHVVTAAQVGALALSGGDMTGNTNFNNNVGPRGRDTAGTLYDLIKVNNYNNLAVGSGTRPYVILSSVNPSYYDGAAFRDLWHAGNLDPATFTNKPFVRVRNTASVSVAANAVVAIPFNTIITQENGVMWTNTAPTRLTCQSAGVYMIHGFVRTTGGGGDGALYIRLNAATMIAGMSLDTSVPVWMPVVAIYKMNVGDYVELVFEELSATAWTITNASAYSPLFEMVKLH